MLRALVTPLRSPIAVAAGLVSGLGVFALIVWLPNLGLIWTVVTSGSMSFSGKLGFLWSSLGAIGTAFTTLGASLTIAVAVLVGLNVTVAVGRLRFRVGRAGAGGATGVGGIAVALLGAGCSSCGTIVLSTLFGTGAGASLAGLPLGGEALQLASAAILAATLAFSVREAARPDVCPLPAARRSTERAQR